MSAPRTAWRSLLAAASLVLIGAALGVSADRLIQMHHAGPTVRLPNGAVIQLSQIHTDAVGVLDRVMKLRPDQRTRIATIMATRQKDIDKAWAATQAQLRATIDSVVNEIAAVLDADQARAFWPLVDSLHGSTSRGMMIHHR